MVWYRTDLRTDRKRDSKTAKGCSLSNSMRVTENFFQYFFHYPRYPWEQKGSHGSCMVVVAQLVNHLRVSCCALCCGMPVFAEELEYKELVFFLGKTHNPPFPLGGKWIPFGHPETASRWSKQSGAIQRDVPLVSCEVDMVVLSSYYNLAT